MDHDVRLKQMEALDELYCLVIFLLKHIYSLTEFMIKDFGTDLVHLI